MSSRAYQLPTVSRPGEPPARDYVFGGPEIRRMTSEQFADAIGSITGEWSVSLIGAGIGALAGGGSLWLMGFLWEKLRGVEAMGFGDVKMMLMVGAYFGWRLAVLTILIGVFTGSLGGIALMLRRGRRNLQMMLPFGIFLGVGAIICLLVGTRIAEWYASQFR